MNPDPDSLHFLTFLSQRVGTLLNKKKYNFMFWSLFAVTGSWSNLKDMFRAGPGVYIMQNTMLGEWSLGKKMKNSDLGEKKGKGKSINNWEKALKMHLLCIINSKNKYQGERGGGSNDQNAQYIPLGPKVQIRIR